MDRFASGLSVLFLPLLIACGDSRQFVALRDQDAETFVLAHRTSSVSPWDVQIGGASDQPVLEVGPEDELRLLLYDEPRAELGLGGGAEPRCQVLHPQTSLRLADRDGFWSFIEDTLDRQLATALVGSEFRCDPCAPLEATAVIGPRSQRYSGAAWFDEDRVLVSGDSGLAIASRTEIVPIPDCPGLIERPWGLAAAGPGRFWVGGGARELARIRLSPDGQDCEVETSTLAPIWTGPERGGYVYFGELAPDPADPTRHDIVAVRATGEVFRWTSAGLQLLGRMEDHPTTGFHDYDSLIRPDTETVLAAHGWTKVHVFGPGGSTRIEDVEIPSESIATRPRDRITALSVDAARDRFLLGSAYGDLWARPRGGGVWARVGESSVSEVIGGLWTTTRRHVIVHEAGDVGFLHLEEGACDVVGRIPQATRSATLRTTLERDGTFFIADVAGANDREAVVVWLREPD